MLSRQIQQQLFHRAAGLPSLPHLLQRCVRASNQVMINISTYCLLTLARRELLFPPVLPQVAPPHLSQNSRKTRFSMVQSPKSHGSDTEAPGKPANLHAGKTHEEWMVTSQAVCIGMKKHILLWNNSFSTIRFFAPSPKFCQRGLLLNTTPFRIIATE